MLHFGLRGRLVAMSAVSAAAPLNITARRLLTSSGNASSSAASATSTSRSSAGTARASPSSSFASTPSVGRHKAVKSMSSPSAASAAADSIHKLSDDKAEASAYVCSADDVPSYSSASHMGYLMLHSRRLWLPLVLYACYYTLSAYLNPVQAGLYATASVVAQRLSVHGRRNKVHKDMTGYTCVVTGGTSGIGLYTAMQLLDMGAHVIIAAPSGKETETMDFLQRNCRVAAPAATATVASSSASPECEPLENRVTFISMDYMDQLDVMAAAARIKALAHDRIDLLVNCAGVWKEEPTLTKQKLEEHIGVNFLGPFHFTEALLPSLRKSSHRCGRIVYVTCASHNGVSRGNVVRERMMLLPGPNELQITARCYSASKLGNIYHAQSIANRRYEGIPLNRQSDLHPVDVCCADPGFCFTSLQQANVSPFLGNSIVARTLRSLWIKDAYEGSQTVVNCCVRDTIENGGYYAECALMPSGLSKRAQDPKSRDDVVRWAMAKTIAKYYTVRQE
ncbi:putative short chain dehydrogenase/reductase [Leishmania major strain Friedlin]|uniref:Putative short chain dehydrogenase/reductase n=1 Tax=Leishmania major TaxID=5664 RepID=Q4QAE9_LEIMA|nr:putative short chain dehydrogenase/reductase [Leishmania major strain Friedlin]CAG9574655.1 short_chain_dehydrogenase/reductase_-_putative [Leishmania major strain Friedlin]CAJ05247.1 putative short chain dehydrogenase/reductase [Leishmania major strain Friedlin]|eukprot:XP_001683699.1 putative short chain dehydrogenase/reductase [Leishmania major strain Friedlin]